MRKNIFFYDPSIVGHPLQHFAVLTLYLFLFWLLITGSLHAKFLVIGIITAPVVSWICLPLLLIYNKNETKKYFAFGVNPLRFFRYCIWLLKELILSNLDVAKAVWMKKMAIQPVVLAFSIHLDNPMAVTTLSNSITLTPGTTNLNITNQDVYEVHALTKSAADGIESGVIAKKVARLYQESDTFLFLGEVSECTSSI